MNKLIFMLLLAFYLSACSDQKNGELNFFEMDNNISYSKLISRGYTRSNIKTLPHALTKSFGDTIITYPYNSNTKKITRKMIFIGLSSEQSILDWIAKNGGKVEKIEDKYNKYHKYKLLHIKNSNGKNIEGSINGNTLGIYISNSSSSKSSEGGLKD